MITQKSISCKLDNWAYNALKEEAHVSGCKANRIINNAIVLYVRWVDMCRRIKCGSAPNLEINEFYQTHRYLDWWKIQPPCEKEGGQCHGECPYYSECHSDYDDEDEEDGGRA